MKFGKQPILLFASLSVLTLLLTSGGRSSSAAPASHTGAPDEESCAQSGCHDDNEMNKGTAMLELKGIDQDQKIEAGKVYELKVKISDPGVTRFGFQLLAVNNDSLKNAGEFIITDKERTQIVQNRARLFDRRYVTYTFSGTDAIKKGEGEWKVSWKAPLNSQKINFYLAAVSANDDMHDKGDKVYTLVKNGSVK
jgi:hypothetical protein